MNGEGKRRGTSAMQVFDLVGEGIVPHERCLGLRDLHEAVFLDLGERDVRLVPCQAGRYSAPISPLTGTAVRTECWRSAARELDGRARS